MTDTADLFDRSPEGSECEFCGLEGGEVYVVPARDYGHENQRRPRNLCWWCVGSLAASSNTLDSRDVSSASVAYDVARLAHLVRSTYEPDFDAWLAYAVDKGWVEPHCATHDGTPLTDEERAYEEEGGDPCTPALRVWMEKVES